MAAGRRHGGEVDGGEAVLVVVVVVVSLGGASGQELASCNTREEETVVSMQKGLKGMYTCCMIMCVCV